MFARKSFILTELLIAIVLLALVILAATSVDITSRRFFAAIKEQAHAQDEAKIAIEHMVRNFVQAHEIYDFEAVASDPWTIGVRLDPNSTPNTDGDDTWIVYRFFGAAWEGEIQYYPNAGHPSAGTWTSTPYEVIATDIVVPPDSYPPGRAPMFMVTDNRIDIDITAGDGDISVNLQTSVILRSMSAT